jgi:hypothetical protein
MNPQQARERVAETFPKPFNKVKFLEFSRNLLNKFDESKAQAWNSSYVKDAFKPHVSRFERLGTYTSGCGRSRAIVTGARAKGGKASIAWDDSSAFTAGRKYSRKEISTILGGSEIEYLPTVNKCVVCGCLTMDCNPEAPDIIIPGTGKVIEREAKLFCGQDYPVPIFIKRRVNEWEYVGDYKADRFSTSAADIAAHHKGSITPLNEVTRVIFLKRAPDARFLGGAAR